MTKRRNSIAPPAWANQFLEWYCADHLLDEIQGDLFEAFHHRSRHTGDRVARWRFVIDVFRFFRPSSFRRVSKINSPFLMINNYLRTSRRNFQKNWSFNSINLLGLVLGITSCLLIALHLKYEFSYDREFSNSENIHRIVMDTYGKEGKEFSYATTFPAVAPGIKEELPQINEYVRILREEGVFSVQAKGNKVTNFKAPNVAFADPGFFELFEPSLLYGNTNQLLGAPNQVVLTKTLAERFFGTESPIGKQIKWQNQINLVVKGVIEDLPENTHLELDALISLNTRNDYETRPRNWGWGDFHTYILVEPSVDLDLLNTKLGQYLDGIMGESFEKYNYRVELKAQPLHDVHLKSEEFLGGMGENGDAQSLYFLMVLGILILSIAWMNFLNLTTARAVNRAKEVGVRKVIGATRKQLVRQFLFESLLYNLTATLIAFALMVLFIPEVNEFFSLTLTSPMLLETEALYGGICIVVMGTFISGIYPAFVLTSFKPISVLKGNGTGSTSKLRFRQWLMVFQFAASAILILGTIVISRQIQFMKSQELGLNIDQTLVLGGVSSLKGQPGLATKLQTLKNQLVSESGTSSVTVSSLVPGRENFSIAGFQTGVGPSETKDAYRTYIDEEFCPSYEIPLIAGRNFDRDMATDRDAVLINHTALELFGYESPEAAIGQVIKQQGEWTILGVTEDFHQTSFKNAVQPTVFFFNAKEIEYVSIKLNAAQVSNSVKKVEGIWQSVFPELPFNHFFLDAAFDQQYRAEEAFERQFAGFASLAIFIACLGLFGLVSFAAEQRKKEIGIRKVLGASTLKMVFLFLKSFVGLLIFSFVIAFPAGYLLMKGWLADFAYATKIGADAFILSGGAIVLIALSTSLLKCYRAASSNPVEVLKEF